MPCRSATFMVRSDCHVFAVSTSSHHGYASGVPGTDAGGPWLSIAPAAWTSHCASWVALSYPYCHAHASESAPTVAVPFYTVTWVVAQVP